MNYTTPEKVGIKSENILKYVKSLEDANLFTHDLIIMRHGKIIYEAYWKPFNKDFLHRMYSVSKSFVSLAIGFLEQDGLISLDDKLEKYFPDELKNQPDENMHNQTIRHTLMMATCKTCMHWFNDKPLDRVRYYFENPNKFSRPSGTVFEYDSSGSFVLTALVERLTKMNFMDYLRSKLFDKIGVSKDAYCLKCPGGHSWGDSAILCTPYDLLLTAQFVLNGGKWNGEQILNEEYLKKATSKQIDNNNKAENEYESQGYGYQFWRTYDNSFFFNGMGCQLAICVPDKDMILVYNGDNQGRDPLAKKTIIDNFFNMIARCSEDKEICENAKTSEELYEYTKNLSLNHAKGKKSSAVAEKINNITYTLTENQMGITKIRFSLNKDDGTMYYTNAQGDKEIKFGMCKNEFTEFPENGYADEIGTVPGNIRYKCASSAVWTDDVTLSVQIQIIDKYMGVLHMKFKFFDDKVGIYMTKTAEDFLDTYSGYATGTHK